MERYELVDNVGNSGNISPKAKQTPWLCSYKVSVILNVIFILCSIALGLLLYFQMDFAEYPNGNSPETSRAAPSITTWVPLKSGKLSLAWHSKNDSIYLWYGISYKILNSSLLLARGASTVIAPVFGNAYSFSPGAETNVLDIAIFGVDTQFKKTMGRQTYIERRHDQGKGACSDEDAGTMSFYRPKWVPETGKCGSSCLGVGQCTANCIQKAFRISQGCANCFGALTSCTVDNCALSHGDPCLKDTTSLACIKCATKYCRPGVVSCTGLPRNFIPQPEPVPKPRV
jgi:hypothetical protein